MNKQIGLIGVGIMGSQIARKLTGAGYAVTGARHQTRSG